MSTRVAWRTVLSGALPGAIRESRIQAHSDYIGAIATQGVAQARIPGSGLARAWTVSVPERNRGSRIEPGCGLDTARNTRLQTMFCTAAIKLASAPAPRAKTGAPAPRVRHCARPLQRAARLQNCNNVQSAPVLRKSAVSVRAQLLELDAITHPPPPSPPRRAGGCVLVPRAREGWYVSWFSGLL